MSKTFLIAMALGLAVVLHHFDSADDPVFASQKDVHVIDGDTIAVGDKRHRLIGFDTPETYRARCKEELRLGQRAKARLEQLVEEHGGISLQSKSRRDKYGRILSVASINGADVAQILISEGLARPYSGGKRSPWCAEGEQQ